MTAPDHHAPTIFTASNVYHQTLDNRRSYGLCPRNWQGEHVNAAYASGSYASHADVAHNYHFQVGDLMWTHFASGAEHLTPIEGFTVPCAPLARTTGVVDANLPLPPYWNPGYFPVQHYPDASITTADHELGASSTGSYSGIPPGEMPYNIPDAASLLHERPSLFQGDAVPQSQDSLPQGSLFEPVRSPEEPLRTNIAHSSEILTCHVDGCDKSFRERHRYNKHLLSHTRHYSCAEEDCGYSAYLVKDLRRHITTVHRKAKIPCPVKGCAYSKDGRKGGISRRDALRRHLKSHGITFESTNQAKNNRSRSQDVSETSTIRTTRNYQAIDISQRDPG